MTTAPQVPVPDSIMTCGFEEALSRMEMVPDFTPELVGEKVTLMTHLPRGATLWPQVLELRLNWSVTFMEEMASVVPPLLVRVTVSGLLVVPTRC